MLGKNLEWQVVLKAVTGEAVTDEAVTRDG